MTHDPRLREPLVAGGNEINSREGEVGLVLEEVESLGHRKIRNR